MAQDDLYQDFDPNAEPQPSDEPMRQRMEQTTDESQPLEVEPVKEEVPVKVDHEKLPPRAADESHGSYLGRLAAKYGDKILDLLSPSTAAQASEDIPLDETGQSILSKGEKLQKAPISSMGEKFGPKELEKLGYERLPSAPSTPVEIPESDITSAIRRELAKQKLEQSAIGTKGEGVISELPSSRVLAAKDKLAQAAKGVASGETIALPEGVQAAAEVSPEIAAKVTQKLAGTEAAPLIAKFGLARAAKFLPAIGNLVMALQSDELATGQESPEIQARLANLAQRSKTAMAAKAPEASQSDEGEDEESPDQLAGLSDKLQAAKSDAQKVGSSVSQPLPPNAQPDEEAPSEAAPALQPQQGPGPAEQFAAAQAAARQGVQAAQLGRAGALMGSGIAGAFGGGIVRPTAIDEKGYEQQMAVAQQIPQQVLQKLQVDREDANSDVSRAARDFIQKSIGISVPNNISAAALKEQFPVIEKYLQSQEANKQRALTAKMHMDAMQMRQKELDAFKQQAMETAKEKDYQSKKLQFESRISAARTSSPDVQQSEKDLLAVDKVAPLLKPNINTSELPLAIAEIDKIATGGVPQEASLKKMMPSGVQQRLANLYTFAKSAPQSAQAQEYVKTYQKYINDLRENAQNHITSFYDRQLKTTGSFLRPEDKQAYIDINLNRFKNQEQAQAPSQGSAPNEERRQTKDGRIAIFDKDSKKFLRYE